jgi:hypothetical protein
MKKELKKEQPLLAWYTNTGKNKTLSVYRGHGNIYNAKVYKVEGIRDARKLSKKLGAIDWNY